MTGIVSAKERDVQVHLNTACGGKMEVEVGVLGRSDIITSLYGGVIFEVKRWPQWKDALGQVLVYNSKLRKATMYVHCFGPTPTTKQITEYAEAMALFTVYLSYTAADGKHVWHNGPLA